MVETAKELDGLIDEAYVPSSIERRKAVLMYFFVGIVAALSKDTISVYEYFHLKQALGWRMVFFMSMMIGVVFGVIFIFAFSPFLGIIPIFLFIVFMIVRGIFVKQAYEGRYVVAEDKILMPFFAALGGRIVTIFELDVYDPEDVEE